jgi:hypothetical protein
MGQLKTSSGTIARGCLGTFVLGIFCLACCSSPAQATPFHPRTASRDVTGLNHACGVAVDSKGDLYASSAGESKIKVYDPSHALLTEISDANTPCGLAVSSIGVLYVSEKATGEVVSFKPNKYPFEGTPTYGSREVLDASGKAKGIAVDGFDDGLYVAEGDRVSSYVNELQTVAIENSTGGTFTLKFEGQETAAIPFNASAAELKAALGALSTIGAGNVEVTKPSLFFVFFVGKFAHTDVTSLSGKESGLTGPGPLPVRVRVGERSKGRSAQIGEGVLSEASGVAAFTQPYGPDKELKFEHFLWVADAKGLLKDSLSLFRGQNANVPELRRELDGAATPAGSFGFGAAGAYLAADSGNRNTAGAGEPANLNKIGECKVVGAQACTAGHLFLYDAAHKTFDEFDASGEYLDQIKNAAFADAEPTAMAVDRSGVAEKDGTLYVTAGPGAGAKALAFGPLKAPSREILGEPLSHKEVKKAQSVAVDSHGDTYVATASAGLSIHIYGPNGTEITAIEDTHKPFKVAVDSTGKVYVADANEGTKESEATYYTPSKYPPDAGTTYERRAEPIIEAEECPLGNKNIKGVAINPGPNAGKDHLFVNCGINFTRLYDSAANGSTLIDAEFAQGLLIGIRESIAVNGITGTVYFGENVNEFTAITAVDEATKKLVTRFEDTGFTSGKFGHSPSLAVDLSNGHVIEYDGVNKKAREYDAAGGFVAEFGTFTEGVVGTGYGVAVDNACVLHQPEPLSGQACNEYDPATGTFYVAFDDTSASNPPYDVNAFAPLRYPEPPKHKLTVEKKGTGSGTVVSAPAGINCDPTCSHEYLETEVVTLTETPGPNSVFEGWEGCEAEPSATKCEVTMSEDRKVVPKFKAEGVEKSLTVKNVGVGLGSVTSSPEGIDCASGCNEETAEFAEGTPVILTAIAAPGSEFVKWIGCDSVDGEGKCHVTMTSDKEVKAEFGVEHPLLTVIEDGTGTGSVVSVPSGIDCPSTSCSHKFDLNDEVTLEAEADPGSVFAGWSGAGCSGTVTCKVTMTEAKSVSAMFEALPGVEVNPTAPILYDEATLRGKVDPEGLATKYHFKYLTEQEYEDNGGTFEGARTTTMEELAPGAGFVPVEAPLVGLDEGVEYRFRLGAENAAGPAEDEGTFETLQRKTSSPCANAAYRFGLAVNLPDCRAYELVTPGQTDGLTPEAATYGGSPSQGVNNWLTVQHGKGAGERLTYFTEGTLSGFEGNGVLDGYRATRGAEEHPPGGWQSTLFSPSYAESAPSLLKTPNQLGVAPDQLYSVWEITDGVETFPETLPSGTYLRSPTGFEALGRGELGTDPEALRDYLSAGGAHAIFSSKSELDPEAPPAPNAALYDRKAGSSNAHVLTLPPDSASEEEEVEFTAALRSKEQASYRGASEDGATVAFKVGAALYVRLNDTTTERVTPKTAELGDTLRCAAGPQYEGGQTLQPRHFQWLRDGAPIPGASGDDVGKEPDYTPKAADEGAALQCLTVATDQNPRSLGISAPVFITPLEESQAPQPPAQIVPPTPSSPSVGTTETCNPGSWSGAISLAYKWYRNGEEIAAATASTYEVQAGDVPGTIQCVVSGANAATTVSRASGLTATSPAPAEAAPVATAQAAPKTTYAGISEDGRYVFYARGNGESPGRLFRFDTQTEETEEIAVAGIFAAVSPDGSDAFFSEEAEAGKHNLYAWDGTEAHLVGELSPADFDPKGFAGIGGMSLNAWTRAIGPGVQTGRVFAPVRTTPDGNVFVFQSHARLTAYDNEGAGEIYRYDASAEPDQRLLCVSCDPSGAPPSSDALLEDIGHTSVEPETMISNVADSGQEVFFQSFDRLLPEDANEAEDVYEWEAQGSEGCTHPGGCLALISSGQGETPSILYAMSADGHDVFIQTKERLVGADVAGSPSIYDARVGGGIPEPAEAAPCQGDACQGQGSEPPVLPNPATSGAGESGEVAPSPRPCAKGKHRVKGHCVAIKHRHRKRHRRAHANRGGNR